MKLLIKQATIVHPSHPLNGAVRDLLIEKGVIKQIAESITDAKAKVIEAAGLHLSIGWMDVGVYSGDPGFEHRETIESLSAAAAAGGYTAVACQPNTQPVIDSKSAVLYLKNNGQQYPVDIHVIGAISVNSVGKDLTEMYDMYHVGAVAFSDGKYPIQDSGMMMRALQYVKGFDGVIFNQPLDAHIAGDGQMHEGAISTRMGMKGIPALAEELMVQRDIELAAYTQSRLHLANISSAKSVSLVKAAKAKGINVTASVAALNLAFADDALLGFNPYYKVQPVLRDKKDQKALQQALKTGVIDFVSSNHTPYEQEEKELEFFYAKFGAIGLESTFGIVWKTMCNSQPLVKLITQIALTPRVILGVELPEIAEGATANLTLFQPDVTYTFTKDHIRSKSSNTPLIGQELKGKVIGIVKENHWIPNEVD